MNRAARSDGPPRRLLGACCGAHVLHDGFSDLLYVLLPIWQAAFGLSLAQTGLLKSLYSGTMAALQVPSSLLAERWSERAMLVAGTLLAGAGFLLAGGTSAFMTLALCLVVGGAGASVQHPIASALVSRAFDGARLRAALGTYNFSGDLGKVIVPAACAALLAIVDWHLLCLLLGAFGFAVALVLAWALPGRAALAPTEAEAPSSQVPVGGAGMLSRGFVALSAIGVIDSMTRMGFLTLLPFVLIGKGASVSGVGVALSLVFAGGACGKFCCGLLAARLGVLRTTAVTELMTALGIVALLPLPLDAALILLAPIGVALNGTSSVLYGTVPELVSAERRARAFGVFYTLTIGAGAIAPTLYGAFADVVGIPVALNTVAASVLLVLPLLLVLRPALAGK